MSKRLAPVFILVFAAACSSEVESDLSAVESQPAVSLSDLVAAERHDATPPDSPHRISISQKEIELDGQTIVELDGRKLPQKASGDPGIALLRYRLESAQGKAGAVLRVHANASWGVLARVLATLEQLRIAPVMFEVRKDLDGNVGYLALGDVEIDASGEPKPFQGALQKDWDQVVSLWEAMSNACSGRGAVHCPSPSKNVPVKKGGLAELELFVQQDAMRVRFQRFFLGDDPDPAPVKKRKPKKDEPEVPEPEPVAEIEFMWRREAAHVTGSPIGDMLKPLCGRERCGVVLRSPGLASAGSMIRLLAAAHPAGTGLPYVRVVIPPDA